MDRPQGRRLGALTLQSLRPLNQPLRRTQLSISWNLSIPCRHWLTAPMGEQRQQLSRRQARRRETRLQPLRRRRNATKGSRALPGRDRRRAKPRRSQGAFPAEVQQQYPSPLSQYDVIRRHVHRPSGRPRRSPAQRHHGEPHDVHPGRLHIRQEAAIQQHRVDVRRRRVHRRRREHRLAVQQGPHDHRRVHRRSRQPIARQHVPVFYFDRQEHGGQLLPPRLHPGSLGERRTREGAELHGVRRQRSQHAEHLGQQDRHESTALGQCLVGTAGRLRRARQIAQHVR